jgi:BASS family bile acid:Na+ symporter
LPLQEGDFVRHVERQFWLICLVAIALGLFVPQSGLWLSPHTRIVLMAILFFTYLKIDFREVLHHLRRPAFLGYLLLMLMVVLPVAVWGAGRLAMPAFVLGIVILGAMPAGTAGSSLTQVAGGNAALALVGTSLTTFAAPLTIPLMVHWLGGSDVGGGTSLLLKQTAWLALVLFAPAVVALVVRRFLPRLVDRFRPQFTGLAILSLSLLILAIVAATSRQILHLMRETPWQAVRLFAFMTVFAAVRYLSAFAWGFWRPWPDRVALSVNAGYLNNALAMTFGAAFFKDAAGEALAAAVLPAVFVEIPMVFGIVLLQRWVRSIHSRSPQPAPAAGNLTLRARVPE